MARCLSLERLEQPPRARHERAALNEEKLAIGARLRHRRGFRVADNFFLIGLTECFFAQDAPLQLCTFTVDWVRTLRTDTARPARSRHRTRVAHRLSPKHLRVSPALALTPEQPPQAATEANLEPESIQE